LSLAQALQVSVQIARALARLTTSTSSTVTSRRERLPDLSEDAAPRVVLLDFGIARSMRTSA
jgi:hypothetical protein